MPLDRLLERQKLDNGNAWPETIAVVLWGTDNIKTYGESLAQVHTCYCCVEQLSRTYLAHHELESIVIIVVVIIIIIVITAVLSRTAVLSALCVAYGVKVQKLSVCMSVAAVNGGSQVSSELCEKAQSLQFHSMKRLKNAELLLLCTW